MEFYTCIAKYTFFGIRDEKLLASARKSWYHTMVCSGIEAVITGLTRNQFEGNLTRVRIPPAAPKEEETHSRLFLFVLHLLPLLPPEVDRQHDRGVDQRGGEDNEREVALHLVARRRETLDE